MLWLYLAFAAVVWTASGSVTAEPVQNAESLLITRLLDGYQRQARPAVNASQAVNVSLGVTLNSLSVDTDKGTVTLFIWVNLSWNDYRLAWNSSELPGQLSTIRLRREQVWMPDVMPYNTDQSGQPHWLSSTPVVVDSQGGMLHVGAAYVTLTCPFDPHQPYWLDCSLKLGSWVYSGQELDFTAQSSSADLSSYVSNDLWNLVSAPMERHAVFYSCCPDPYIDMTMKVRLRAREQVRLLSNMPSNIANVLMLFSFLVPLSHMHFFTLPCLSMVVGLAAALFNYTTNMDGNAANHVQALLAHQINCYVLLCVFCLKTLLLSAVNLDIQIPHCVRSLIECRPLKLMCCFTDKRGDSESCDGGSNAATAMKTYRTKLCEVVHRCFGLIFLALQVTGVFYSMLYFRD